LNPDSGTAAAQATDGVSPVSVTVRLVVLVVHEVWYAPLRATSMGISVMAGWLRPARSRPTPSTERQACNERMRRCGAWVFRLENKKFGWLP